MKEFLPILLGTDANCYGMARSFYDEYQIKPLAIGKIPLKETKNSKIVNVITFDNFDKQENFLPNIIKIAQKYKEEYKKLLLISCGDGYTELIVNNREELSKYFIIPYISRDLKEQLENKESFYEICEKYNLDYPKTYIVTKKTKDKLDFTFPYPVAVKASNSITYLAASFKGKKKGYKAENEEELRKILDAVYSSSYEDNMIIQEFVPGDDKTMYVLNSYSNKDGKVKMMCLGHSILEDYSPAGIGNYKAIISDSNGEIYSRMKKFLEEIQFVGFSNFDMKYDERDGKYKLFEINIRQGRSSYFVTAAGHNLAKYLVEDYIYNKDEEIVYNNNKHLWLGTPKKIVLKYVSKDIKNEVKELIKNKKYSYTLWNKKDISLYRLFWVARIYQKDFALFKKYFNKRGMEDE